MALEWKVLRPEFFLHLGMIRSFLRFLCCNHGYTLDIVNIGGKIFWTMAITDFVEKREFSCMNDIINKLEANLI